MEGECIRSAGQIINGKRVDWVSRAYEWEESALVSRTCYKLKEGVLGYHDIIIINGKRVHLVIRTYYKWEESALGYQDILQMGRECIRSAGHITEVCAGSEEEYSI